MNNYGANWDQTSKHLRPNPKTTAVFIVMSTSPRIGILATPGPVRHCRTIRRRRVHLWSWHTLNVRWPDPNQAWEMPQTGHIDGYGGRWLPLMLVATAYLYDIQTYPGRAAESPSSSPRQIAEKKDRPSTCPSRSASSSPPSRSSPCRLGDFALLGELSLNSTAYVPSMACCRRPPAYTRKASMA